MLASQLCQLCFTALLLLLQGSQSAEVLSLQSSSQLR